MLKFLKEEQKRCSQVCHSNAQMKSPAKMSNRAKNPSATFCACTKQKCTKCINLNKQTPNLNLPYLSVCLKDLRRMWPNLNLETVKWNPNKHEDFHHGSSDQVLHCINIRSKKKKKSLFVDCSRLYRSTNQSKLCPPSSLPGIKLERVVTQIGGTTVKCDLQCRCNKPGSPLSITDKSCHTKADLSCRNHMTVIINSTDKKTLCVEKQNNLKPTGKNAQKNSLDKSTSPVNFGGLINHLIKSETDDFAEFLNQNGSSIQNETIQTRFRKNKQKMSVYDCSLSSSRALEFERDLNNLIDPFPKENTNFRKNSRNSTENVSETTFSAKRKACDVLVIKDCESTETKSGDQENITELPQSKLSMHSKNVKCIKNSQLCLPVCSTRKLVSEKQKKRTHADSLRQSGMLPKRYSRNILGKCKLCDVSHRPNSVPRSSHLFCKCTIKLNSGILKNLKVEGLRDRVTTEKDRNTHLKVVVERLKDSIHSDNALNRKDVCKRKKGNVCNREAKANSCALNQGYSDILCSGQLLQKPLNNVRRSHRLKSRFVTQTNCVDLAVNAESIDMINTPFTTSTNTYFSPIKLMFVSKVESEDGVKYTLSSEYTPLHKNRDDQPLEEVVKHSGDVVKKSETSDCNSQSSNPNSIQDELCRGITSPSTSETLATAQNLPAETMSCLDECSVERKLARPKKLDNQVLKMRRSVIGSPKSKNLAKKKPVKVKSDITLFPDSTTNSIKHSKIRAHFGRSHITENYVVKNMSRTQMKIKKIQQLLESSEKNLCTSENAEPQANHTASFNSGERVVTPRISKRLQRLRKRFNVSSMCVTTGCISEKGRLKNVTNSLPPFHQGMPKKIVKSESCRVEQKLSQITNIKNNQIQRSSLVKNHSTRSKKQLLIDLCSVPPSTVSVRSALHHKPKKLHLAKCKVYRRKLRSYKQHYKLPLKYVNSINNEDQRPHHSADPAFQSNTALKWWSASTSNESLVKDFDSKYEDIANMWISNVEKDSETQFLPTLTSCSSETMSPVQILFKKKCDVNDLAAWFMETTETQSLSIVRKEDACSPLPIINRRGSRTKQASIDSHKSKNHFKKCMRLASSDTLKELDSVSKFFQSEAFTLKISKRKRKGDQNPNHLQGVNDEITDVYVKFACPGKILDVTKVCGSKVTNNHKTAAKEIVQMAKNDLKDATCHETALVPNAIVNVNSVGNISFKNHKSLLENEPKSKQKKTTCCESSKKGIKDCKVFLTKVADLESKMSHTNGVSYSGNAAEVNKYTLRSDLNLNSGFSTKYHLQMDKTLAKPPCSLKIERNSISKKYSFEMCLRKTRRTVVTYDNHCTASILERRKRHSKIDLFLETNKKRPKQQLPVTEKKHTDYPKFQLGSLKPVGIPAIRGLSSKDGTYSLTPIRIPFQ